MFSISFRTTVFAHGLACAAALLTVNMAGAQFEGRLRVLGKPGFAAPAVAGPVAPADSTEPKENEELVKNGASLKTDPELQRLVGRSETFVKENRYDLASVLWQKVLDEAGDSLMTKDNRLYISVRGEVEQTLRQLPKLALSTYRISADGEAQAVLSRAPADDPIALGEVVRRFFLSSLGDDSAYKLGCQALDRYDFVAAARLFEKVLLEYPDPSVSRSDLLVRYALASARLGDQKSAQAALTELAKTTGQQPPASVIGYVKTASSQPAPSLLPLPGKDLNWLTTLGNTQHTGQMPATPREITKKTLSDLWVYDFPLVAPSNAPQSPYYGGAVMIGGGIAMSRSGPGQPQVKEPASRDQIISSWRTNGWMPTSQLLFDNGRVYMKTCDRLVSVWQDRETPRPNETASLNEFDLDGMSWTMALYGQNYGMLPRQDDTRPRNPLDVQLFGDRVHACMSIVDGKIYSIEGRELDREGKSDAPKVAQRQFQWGSVPRRVRQNWLACYEPDLKRTIPANPKANYWRRGASDNEKEASTDIGFLAAPVGFGDNLLIPVTEGGTIWLYALAKSDGHTVWKSYLCDEPAASASPWSPVSVAVDGSDAYVVCGMGVVIAVDAGSGAIHWAVRYARSTKQKNIGNQYGIPNFPQELNGFAEDTAIIHGRAVVVAASDYQNIMALDRRTGDLLWEAPARGEDLLSADYCLGVSDDGLIVGGKKMVRRYNINGGRMLWETEFNGDSYGRGAVTADAIYVPVKDSILVLDPRTGKEVSQVGVKLTTNDPVGNVYVDGEKVWVASPGRLITLTNLEHRMATLAKQIAEGNSVAQLNRMRLYAKSNQLTEALADLHGAYQLIQKASGDQPAQQQLLDSIRELQLPQLHAAETFTALDQVFLKDKANIVPTLLPRRREIVGSALTTFKANKDPRAIETILQSLPLFDQDYLLALSSAVLSESAKPEHLQQLIAAVQGEDTRAQTIAIAALAKIEPDDAALLINNLLESKDERVKVAAARVSLNLGNRKALQEFVNLLNSEDQSIRLKSFQSLRYATKQQIPFDLNKPADGRAGDIKKWQEWVTASGELAELKLPLPETSLPLGRTLLAFRNQLVELDESHNERWQRQVTNVFVCQGLPNGNRLYGTLGARGNDFRVVELNEQGEEVWKSPALPGSPLGLHRLTNGNTLVSCTSANQVIELNAAGETVWQVNLEGQQPMGIERLDNGNTLVALSQSGRVVEIDADKKIVWEARGRQGPASVHRLPSGNTLIAEMYTNKVSEVDAKGQKEVWKKEGLQTPRDARRLPNGNTLIAEGQSVQEVDPKGNVVWQRRGQGASCISLY